MTGMADALKEQLNSGPLEVRFTKKDGSERKMKCTRCIHLIPEINHPKGNTPISTDPDLISVYDLENEGWRSFRASKVSVIRVMDDQELRFL